MRNIKGPDSVQGRRGRLAVLGAVLAPLAVLALLAPDLRDQQTMASASSIVGYTAVLFAVALLYFYWRANGGPIGWLVLGLTAVTVQALGMSGMSAADPVAIETHPGWMGMTQILVGLGVGALVPLSRRRPLRVDPLVVGAIVGLAVVALRYVLITTTPSLDLSAPTIGFLRGLVLVVGLAITVALYRLTVAPSWVRIRLAAGWGLLSVAQAATYPAPTDGLFSSVTIVANIIGAAVLLALAVALLRISLADSREQLRIANSKLERAEADVREDAARLHEIRATIAGLTSASQLIRQADTVGADRRQKIEAMMDSEMGRLQRLLHDQPTTSARSVDLDEVIAPLVLRHQLRGFPVQWRPSGERVIALGDNVAEVVNVLLENAFQHAGGAGAWIYTRHIDGTVEVAVSDSGPGVDRSVRPRIFEWGEHSMASSGSGIGLNVAQQLTVELGGYLRLVDSPALGATFVFGLPAEERQ